MIPILLITGFLGAGKTTFINWLLEKTPELKISIILNEFGDIKLESQFIKQQSDNVVELSNGCICCVAKSDIPHVLEYILDKSPTTEYILIEASGLSDPDPVREVLQSSLLQNSIHLESTLCLVDALNFEQMRADHPIINSQIAESDIVLLTKSSSKDADHVNKLTHLLHQLVPDIPIIPFTESLLPEIFLTHQSEKTASSQTDAFHQDHLHDEYITFLYQSEKMFSDTQLINILQNLPESIIRVKGIVHCKTQDGILQTLQTQKVGAHLTIKPHTGENFEKSTILFIGKEFDKDSLKQSLDASVS